MARGIVLAGLLVALPSAGWCQQAPWEVPSAGGGRGRGARTSVSGTATDPGAESPATRARDARPLRVLAEVGGALLGAGAGAGLGAGLGYLLPARFRDSGPLSAMAVALFGMPAGVTLAGHLLGGNGGYGWSLAGLLGGALLALPLAALTQRAAAFQGTIAVVLPLAGAVLGYEVSSDDARPAQTQGPRLFPQALVLSDGALAGVAGRF